MLLWWLRQERICLQCRRPGFDLWVGKIPGGGHGSIPQYSCWRIPWTEESGGLQSMGSHRVRHDRVIFTFPDWVLLLPGEMSPWARGRERFAEWLRGGLSMPGPARGRSWDTYQTQRAGSRRPSGPSGHPLSLSSQYVLLWIPVLESCTYSPSHQTPQSLEKAES